MNKVEVKKDRKQEHFLGRPDAPVTLLEYGDYQCPFCAEAQVLVKEILAKHINDLCYVFRHFPITNIHPLAELAAEAAEAAGKQGKFWPMHNGIFENQNALSPDFLLDTARKLDCDLELFRSDLENRVYKDHIRNDFMNGVKSGVNGTPSFFVNDVRYDGPRDYRSMMESIVAAANFT